MAHDWRVFRSGTGSGGGWWRKHPEGVPEGTLEWTASLYTGRFYSAAQAPARKQLPSRTHSSVVLAILAPGGDASCALFVILRTGTEARRQQPPCGRPCRAFRLFRAVQAGVAASLSGPGHALLCLIASDVRHPGEMGRCCGAWRQRCACRVRDVTNVGQNKSAEGF